MQLTPSALSRCGFQMLMWASAQLIAVVGRRAVGVAVPDLSALGDAPVAELDVAQSNVVPRTVERLRDVLAAHPGPPEVQLRGRGPDKTMSTGWRSGSTCGRSSGRT